MSSEFTAVAGMVQGAKSFNAIFGELGSGPVSVRLGALRSRFAYLARIVHPDRVSDPLKKEAGSVFYELNQLYNRAKEAVKDGRYDTASAKAARGEAEIVLHSPGGTAYRLERDPYVQGDFSALYRAAVVDASGERLIVKIAIDPSLNPWLENEARILKRFANAAPTDRIGSVKKFLPVLRDTFVAPGENGKRYRTNVIAEASGFVSVAKILEEFRSGLDPRDAAWIARRVLAQAVAASMAGVVHGAVTPDHIMVHPETHEAFHTGWAHAIDPAANPHARITHVIDRWKEWYPPEVFEKKTPDRRLDIYMAGKTVLWLFGGDVKNNIFPKHIASGAIERAVLRCVEDSPRRRFQDGKQALDEFTRAVREHWGKAYRPLVMPGA